MNTQNNQYEYHYMWCDLWKPVTCRKRWNCKIKEINILILMFFFIFYGLWTSVTFDTSIRGDPRKQIWKENNSNFQMIPITQNINSAPCDGFSQITSQMLQKIPWQDYRVKLILKTINNNNKNIKYINFKPLLFDHITYMQSLHERDFPTIINYK